jgi:hypothetical protein
MANPNEFVLPVTPEQYEESAKSSSKFASAGLHLSEISELPAMEPSGKSIAFKFKVIEDGDDNGKENKVSAGFDLDQKDASGKVTKRGGIWKLDEVLKALGVERGITKVKNPKTGQMEERVTFSQVACLGKQVYSEWVEQKDSRTPEEGGKGGSYTKPIRFWSLEAGAKKAGSAKPVDL